MAFRTCLLAAGVAVAAGLALPAAPGAANILTVQAATSATATLVEYLPTTLTQATPVQSVSVTGCVKNVTGNQGYGSVSINGGTAMWACGITTQFTRPLFSLSPSGVITSASSYTTNNVAYTPRGVASLDGTTLYVADAHAPWVGTWGSPITTTLTTTNYYYAVAVYPFTTGTALLYSACLVSTIPCTVGNGALYHSTPLLPPNGTGSANVILTGSQVTAIGAVVVASQTVIYVGADTTGTTGGLVKLTSAVGGAAGTWANYTWPSTQKANKNPAAAVVGVRGLTARTEAGVFTLYFSTSATSANSLYRYDTSFDSSATVGAGYTQLATAAAGTAYLDVLIAPITPTPSQTPTSTATPTQTQTQTSTQTATTTPTSTATQSASQTASASLSTGATPTPTVTSTGTSSSSVTGTPSGSGTATQSPTRTASPSTVHLPSPPTPGNVLVMSTAGATATLGEYLATVPTQAAPLQSVSVPACQLGIAVQQAYGSVTADGGYALFPCGLGSGTARVVARVAPSGWVDTRTTYATNNAAYLPRGAASFDGVSSIYIGDEHAPYVGSVDAVVSTTLTTSFWYGAMQVFNFFGSTPTLLYTGCTSATIPCPASLGGIYHSTPLMPTLANQTQNQLVAGSLVVGIGSFVVASDTVIYVGSDQTTAGGGLWKLKASAAGGATDTWAPVTFGTGLQYLNPTATVVGVAGITGRVEAGAFAVYLTTSTGTGNSLWRYDTSQDAATSVGSGYTLLTTANAGTAFYAVLLSPVVPSATPTRTPSATSTPSRTSTMTASASMTGSVSLTSSSSPSTTPSSSSSLTPGASSTSTGTVAPSPTTTPSSAATATPTRPRTGSASTTASSSATPTSSLSYTPTRSMTPSNSATASASASTVHLPSPPTPGNLLVASTGGALATLMEFGSAAANQAAPLQSVFVSACALDLAGNQGYAANSADGGFALFPCGSASGTLRVITIVSPSGFVDTTTTYSTSGPYLPRGVASPDGNTIYAADIHAVWYGTAGNALAPLTTAYWYFGQSVGSFGGSNALVTAGCTVSTVPCTASLYFSSPTLPTTLAASTMNQAMTGVSVPTTGAVLIANSSLIYAGSDVVGGAGGFHKFTASAPGALTAAWSAATFGTGSTLKNPPTTLGVRGLTGRFEGGVYTLYLTTSGATANALYRYDTSFDGSANAAAGFSQLATAAAGTAFLGVCAVPVVPSQTPSRTPTPSHTPSSTSTRTRTASATGTATTTPSATGSPSTTGTTTASASGSPSQTPSITASVSPTISSGATATRTATTTPTSSSSASGSASASRTASRTASASGTAASTGTGTPTRTGTPSASGTATRTPTRTATPSTVHLASPPTPGNLLVVSTTGVAATLGEYSATTAAQAAPLQSVSVPACQLGIAIQQAYGSVTADGGYALFPCGLGGGTARVVARVAPSGYVDTRTTYATNNAAYLPRGAASFDGVSSIYIGDEHAPYVGSVDAVVSTTLTISFWYGAMQVFNFFGSTPTLLYAACTTSTIPCPTGLGGIYHSTPLMPTFANQTQNLLVAGSLVIGIGSFVVASDTVIYVGSDQTTAGGGLWKLKASAAGGATDTWAPVTFGTGLQYLNPTATVVGVAGITGRVEAGAFAVYLTTSTGTGNSLWRYDTSRDTTTTVGAGYTLLTTAGAGTAFYSVLVAPIVPSQTPTRTSTPTSTRTQTGSATSTPSNTPTATGTPTQSPSQTASASSTAASTASTTASLSFGTTPSITHTPSPTDTASASASDTASPTATPSATGTPTPSLTPSQSSSRTQTPSTTGSPSQTASRTGSPSQTPTRTATPSTFHLPAPPTPGDLLVTSTAGGTVLLSEYAPTTAHQASAVQSVTVGACSLALGPSQGYAAASADGAYALFTCSVAGTATRVVARVAPNGFVDTSTTYVTTSTAYAARGVASPDGVALFASDAHGVWAGSFGSVLSSLTAVHYYFGAAVSAAVSGGNLTLLYAACTSPTVPCPAGAGALYHSTPLLPTVATAIANDVQLAGSLVGAIGAVVAASPTVIYAGSDVTTAGGGLYKLTAGSGTAGVGGTWAAATWGGGNTVRNPSAATAGVRGLMGRPEGADFVLYLTTSATVGNALYRYSTSSDGVATVGAGYTQLATAPASAAFYGVVPAPVIPSATGTATPSRTPTATATPTGSPSSSPSTSSSATMPPTPTLTAARTATRTAHATRSSSSSVSASQSITASGSRTPATTPTSAATLSSSSSASPSGSASLSTTATQSPPRTASVTRTSTRAPSSSRSTTAQPSHTGSPSGSAAATASPASSPTASPSQSKTGTPPPTAAASRSPTATQSTPASPSRSPTASRSPSRSPTATLSATKSPTTKTASKTKTPSRTVTASKKSKL